MHGIAKDSKMSILIVFVVLFVLYFLPTITTAWYSTNNNTSVFLINFFLGWTIIGWLVALAIVLKTLTGPQILKTCLFYVIFIILSACFFAFEVANMSGV